VTNPRPLPTWILASIASDVVLLDQATKWLVQKHMQIHNVKTLAPFFNLTHVLNTGASFGMFRDSNRAFIGITLLILAVLAAIHRRMAGESRAAAVGLAFLWGGAVGNLIDRLRVGAVVDFLDFHWAGHHWPAFNVADSAIFTGVALMFLQNLSHDRQQNVPR
jgi:signal peptidase II